MCMIHVVTQNSTIFIQYYTRIKLHLLSKNVCSSCFTNLIE